MAQAQISEGIQTYHADEQATDVEDVVGLLNLARQERRRWWLRRHALDAVALLLILTSFPLWMTYGLQAIIAICILSIVVIAGFGSMSYARSTLTPIQQQTIARLAQLSDLRAIEPLIDFLPRTYGVLRDHVVAALTRLLPRLGPDQIQRLGKRKGAILYSYLDNETAAEYPEYVITLLNLLPHTGDMEALLKVAFLIVHDAPTRNEKRVRDAAHICLPALLDRVDFGPPDALTGWIRRLPTIHALSYPTHLTWEAAILPVMALMHLLPQVSESEFQALHAYDRRHLYHSLVNGGLYPDIGVDTARLGPGCGLSLLDLAIRTRDLEALPYVRMLARGSLRVHEQVRETAVECLPALEALAESEQVGKTLLRASCAPTGEPELLLRPMVEANPTDPLELLRANRDS